MSSDVDKIKSRLDVVEVISKYIKLKKAGANYKAKCPFHKEQDPSFMVSPEKQIWHCFGCGRGGDLISFVEEYEKVDFPEALEILADMAGIELTGSGRKGPDSELKDTLYEIQSLTEDFFIKRLKTTDAGKQALKYLIQERKLNKDTIEHFGIGYAPGGWNNLVRYLQKEGFKNQNILKAGVAVERQGKLKDKFQERVMFPIKDHLTRTVAFTGRALSDDREPKYLNSPDTPIFKKRKILYGLGANREFLKEYDWALMVEGQMDLMSVWQAGVKNVVATSGSALTVEHLKLLKRYTSNLILAFDMDSAGIRAARSSLPLIEQAGLTGKIAIYDAKDPDSLIKDSPEKFSESLQNAEPLVDYFLDSAINQYLEEDESQQKKALEEITDVLRSIEEPVQQEQKLKYTANELSVPQTALEESMRKHQTSRRRPKTEESSSDETTKDKHWLIQRFFGLLFAFPDKAEEIDLPDAEIFGDSEWGRVYREFLRGYTNNSFNTDKLLDSLDDSLSTKISEAALVAEQEYEDLNTEEIRKEINFFARAFTQRKLDHDRKQLSRKIAKAEREGDTKKVEELLNEFKKLTKEE